MNASNYHQVGNLWIEHYAKITSAEATVYRDRAKRCFPDAKIVGITIERDEDGSEHVYAELRSNERLECL
ncbi:MAG: hypothetical protein Q4D06_03790 [Coriobacteriia bacterium]|nr:hypothetical protein [Coriobacteriia bacterium]